jgi:hypothetical protein
VEGEEERASGAAGPEAGVPHSRGGLRAARAHRRRRHRRRAPGALPAAREVVDVKVMNMAHRTESDVVRTCTAFVTLINKSLVV